MTEPERDKEPRAPEDEAITTENDGGSKLESAVLEALDSGQPENVRELLASLHVADVADHLQRLAPEQRLEVVDALGEDFHPEVLSELDSAVREEIIDHLGVADVAEVVAELDLDDAVDLLMDLDVEDQREILDAIPAEDRTLIEEALSYPEDSAGRLMQRELVKVPSFWSVGQTIDFMRECAENNDDCLPELFYDIFVIDPGHRPVGTIPISRLLRSRRGVMVSEIMDMEMNTIPVSMDQEEVAFNFRQRDLVSAPVIDDGGRLVGVITIDDVVDVIDEEQEEDIMRLGGVPEDDLYENVMNTTRSRFNWLLLNLGTAILASMVIGMFEATIEQVVALAVLMPIVASMGGNAGTQTLTVAVRALATRELTSTNALRVITKEFLVGSANGVLFALLTGSVAWLWFGEMKIGLVIAAAMVVNLVAAGLAGTTIPLILVRIGVDPAVASTVFLTTVTDVVGFFAFLGLAAWVLL